MHVHLVQPGDTLEDIARRYRVTPGVLSLRNDLPPASFLLPGSSLCIPSEWNVPDTDGFFTYQVRDGDTARTLSDRFGIPLSWLSFCNEWRDTTLRTGDIVLVPKKNALTRAAAPPSLGLLSLAPLQTPGSAPPPLSYLAVPGLRVNAAGQLHLPRGQEAAVSGHLEAKRLFVCTLDGGPNILPDVAKAILRSDHAQHRILEGMAAQIMHAGGDGVLFAWQGFRRELEPAYLQFVKEAGRRLRPMGLRVALQLSGDAPLLKRGALLADSAAALDHFFYEPGAVPADEFYRAPPAPLIGAEALRQSLQRVSESLPPAKLWAVVHPTAAVVKRGRLLQTIAPHQALRTAYELGAPLQRDPISELAWFRCGEGGCSVWMEDLWSFMHKFQLLEHMQLQGLAMWEAGGYFPEAWTYLADLYGASDLTEDK